MTNNPEAKNAQQEMLFAEMKLKWVVLLENVMRSKFVSTFVTHNCIIMYNRIHKIFDELIPQAISNIFKIFV